MANYDNLRHTDFPIPYKTFEEANNHLIEKPPEEHDALIATLPLQPFVAHRFALLHPLRLYKGVWIPEFFLLGAFSMQQCFKSRPTDIFLASSPKSGTTWLKAMIITTMTRTSYPLDQHPLHTYNPHHCVPYLEREFTTGRSQIIEAIPSTRVMSTHLP